MMRRRIKLKKKQRKINKLILIIFIFVILIFLALKFISLKANPVLLEYAEMESRKLVSIVINDAINKNITENIDIEELFIITKEEDEIKSASNIIYKKVGSMEQEEIKQYLLKKGYKKDNINKAFEDD